MDRLLAKRLEKDEDFQKKIAKLAKDYITLGQTSLNYWVDEFDSAHDILMCYAPLTKTDLENLEKGHPKRFVLPMTSTQITTMTTFIAQVLFGDEVPHKVDGRGPEDEDSASHMNQLLRWNAEQQETYLLGHLWVQDCLTYNRGIFYNSWAPIFETRVETEETPIPDEIDKETGLPATYQKLKKVKVPVAGFNRMYLVSPYDFICDPAFPLWRMQDGRFAGHHTTVTWQELYRRSQLPTDDPAYVSPAAVEKLKTRKGGSRNVIPAPSTAGAAAPKKDAVVSRTGFERSRMATQPQQDANKEDPGIINLHELYIRLVPKDNEVGEGTDSVIFSVLLANLEEVLSVDESPLQHDMFPYSVGEGRPSGYYQYTPGWVMHMKALQDYIDYFKNRRQQAITRTLGNIFIARTDQVNLTDFFDPDKEGLIIPVLPEASGQKLDDIIKQVQVNDMTKEFHSEMLDFINFSEQVSGVNSQMQGQVEGRDTTATEFTGTMQMGAGRLSAIARILSVMGIVPQTRQFVANFQQFLTMPMSVRFSPTGADSPGTFKGQSSMYITPDVLQGRFDYIAHDGSLPGTDNRKVAAISRLLEAAEAFPTFFTPEAGNIDARALILAAAKAAGLNVENFQFKEQPGQPGAGPGALPDLGAVPPALPVNTRGPGRPALPNVDDVPSASPPQIHPQQL